MAQPQRPADVHQDELCPPNKRYALMDANKKIDLDNPLNLNESKIMATVIQNHPLGFSVAASSSEGLHYALKNPSTQIPYPRFTKIIIGYYMTVFLEISRRARNNYHNLEDNAMVKNIFNSWRHKDDVGMKISSWMIMDEMKLTDQYRMTPSTPRLLNLETDEGESSALQKSIVILKEHLIAKEIEKLVEETENVEKFNVNSFTLRQDDTQTIPGTRLELGSDKESPEVEITTEVQPININEEEEESAKDDYELKQNYVFEHLKTRLMPRKKFHALAQHLQEVMEESLPKMVDERVKELTKKQVPLYVTEGLIMEREKSQMDVAKMIADAIQLIHQSRIICQLHHDDIPIWLALKYKFKRLHVATTLCRPSAVRPRDQDDPYDDAHPEGENSAKRYQIFTKGQKRSQNGQNQARNWKEHEKLKSKT
ncbi:hypothetical protein Tco_0653429 [Tanacetum coccineum]|uniref:Uncharacterized protein n=1 Tax=Tanacetum coccineum TaxID=301880 RepID=A0ABQ4X158_9ASTR